MNPLENYKQVVDSVFGAGAATFDTTRGSNNVLGALARNDEFHQFRQNLMARFDRLNSASFDDRNRDALLEAVNELANSKNWEGAYAELAGLDFLISNQDYGSELDLDVTLPAEYSIASEFGKTNTNLDVHLKDFDAYLDIKALSDKSTSILNGIINDAVKQANLQNITIRPEYSLDQDYETFAGNRQALLKELADHLSSDQRSTFFKSLTVEQLNYRILRGSGALTTTSSYSPYSHAEQHHKLVFQHVKKLLRNKPTLLLYVHFPWFSEQQLSVFGSDKIFYRSLARRIFCQYAKNSSPLKSFLKGCNGNISLDETTKYLSGILFINDRSITDSGFESHAFLNPNASNQVSPFIREYLNSLGCAIDGFEHDNY